MSGKILHQEYNVKLKMVQFEQKSVLLPSILLAKIHIVHVPQIIYPNNLNHSFNQTKTVADLETAFGPVVVVGLVKSGRLPDRISCKVSLTFANSEP